MIETWNIFSVYSHIIGYLVIDQYPYRVVIFLNNHLCIMEAFTTELYMIFIGGSLNRQTLNMQVAFTVALLIRFVFN